MVFFNPIRPAEAAPAAGAGNGAGAVNRATADGGGTAAAPAGRAYQLKPILSPTPALQNRVR